MAEKPDTGSQDKDGTADAAKQKLLDTVHARFKLVSEAESELRREALADLEFSAGKQWPEEVRRDRDIDARPCLTINLIPKFIRQITNDQRQNRPSIKVNPVDDNADVETAKIIQGIVRHIEYNSGADVAYDTAFDSAVRGGRGFFRIVTDYCDEQSFDQELLIKRIRNPFMVYMDPSHKEPDGSDANWCFVVEDMLVEDFKEQYGEDRKVAASDFESLGDMAADWRSGQHIRVAEYFYKDFKEVKLALLSTGHVVEDDADEKKLPEGITIVNRRTAKVPVVKWCKLSGSEILEEKETVFDYWIPVIPVIGEELDINGKLSLAGIVRNAKDPQRMYNYWASSETETIALAPRAPFVGAEGQFKGHEAQWKTANRRNVAFLQYVPKDIGGQPLPPPQRQTYEPAIQAITMARSASSEDLKGTTGIYDAQLGNRSNETSGVAIQRRNQQSQTANFHFVDNLTRSQRHAGRILVRAIPKIYDAPRAARIIGEDGQAEVVQVNQPPEVAAQNGKPVYDLSAGKYDVAVETGPSYATKRMEAVASMLDFIKAYPQAAQIVGDLLAKNMDWPGAQEISDRLKKMLPPGMADDKDKQKPLPPQVQAQLQQMSQMIDALTKELHASQDIIQQKKLELDSRERIETLKVQAQLELGLAQIDQKDSVALLTAQIGQLQAERGHFQDAAHADAQADLAQQQQQQALQQAGPEGAAPQNPTGGASPGQPVGNP